MMLAGLGKAKSSETFFVLFEGLKLVHLVTKKLNTD
jgi:hypothetical protein